jgi:hypothetical protein
MSQAEKPTKPSGETPAGTTDTGTGANQVPFKRRSLIADFWEYLMENKKWWILPILLGFFFIMMIVVLGSAPALLPFIYTLF